MTNQPTDEPGIPPYSERDHAAALEAVERAEADERHGYGEALAREIAGAVAWARTEERLRIVAELIEGNGSHDCAPCRDTGALIDGRTCPLCDGFGKL